MAWNLLSSSAWIMFLIFFMIPVLTTWRKTFLGCQTYIVIIPGEVISISTFQELKHTVLGHFFIMPLLIGIGCLMISSQSLWNLFLKEVLKLTFLSYGCVVYFPCFNVWCFIWINVSSLSMFLKDPFGNKFFLSLKGYPWHVIFICFTVCVNNCYF